MYQSDLKHQNPGLEDKLHQLYTLNRDKKIDLSFRPPYLELLEKFGEPHLNLSPVIHVAGTNGKGSVITMLRSILEAAGYSVHAYTSPHLIRFNERIVLNGKPIADEPLEALIDEALVLNANGDVTFFEITTAMAFAAFSRVPADICLIEVGMGGRLDCTNVIEDPLATIITSIGLDHTEHLGQTYAAIAGEKAEIMKAGVPCVIAQQSADAIEGTVMDVFGQKAQALNVEIHKTTSAHNDTALLGPHQTTNLAAVLKTLELIKDDFPTSDTHIQRGLETIEWPARLQQLKPQDLGFSEHFEIYLDGGHNEDAGKAIAKQAKIWQEDGQELHVIMGMMNGKNPKAYLEPIKPFIDQLYLVDIESEPQSQSAAELQNALNSGTCETNFLTALEATKKQHQKPARVLICGSLYLAGHVLAHIEKRHLASKQEISA